MHVDYVLRVVCAGCSVLNKHIDALSMNHSSISHGQSSRVLKRCQQVVYILIASGLPVKAALGKWNILSLCDY